MFSEMKILLSRFAVLTEIQAFKNEKNYKEMYGNADNTTDNTTDGHITKWHHFEILAKGRSDTHCKIKETLLIQELKPTLNDNVSSEKLYLY